MNTKYIIDDILIETLQLMKELKNTYILDEATNIYERPAEALLTLFDTTSMYETCFDSMDEIAHLISSKLISTLKKKATGEIKRVKSAIALAEKEIKNGGWYDDKKFITFNKEELKARKGVLNSYKQLLIKLTTFNRTYNADVIFELLSTRMRNE